MWIRQIETFPLFYPLPKRYGDANGMKAYRTCYLVRITTDEGAAGWGECADWLPALHKGFQERIVPFLLGKPVSERAKLVDAIHSWHPRTAAAVSMALTEITAKSGGISVTDLWGGRFRNAVPVYASFQSYSQDADWEGRSLQAVEAAIAAGFARIKLKIGGKPVREDQRHIGKVQALCHGQAELALDANQSYDAAAALQWQSLLQGWSNILWVEEPLKVKHAAEYALLRQRLPAPLAGGENIADAADFLPLLTRHALDFITPDPLHMAGIDGYREALGLARTFGIRATPHAYDGALARLYALFAQACLAPWSKMGADAIEPVEWDVMDNPFARLIPLQPVRGEVTLPAGCGIGLEIDMELLRFYRWNGSSYEQQKGV